MKDFGVLGDTNKMIINTSQGDIEFNLPAHYKNVGVRMSGGADSAIIAYMLAKYIKEERPDISLVAISLDVQRKEYQVAVTKTIIKFIEEEFNIKFKNHFTGLIEDYSQSGKLQTELCNKLISEKEIDCYFTGLTRNPSEEVLKTFAVETDSTHDHRNYKGNKLTVVEYRYFPLINVNKKAVAEIYEKFRLLDTLFPLTKSCENFSPTLAKDASSYCKIRCWGCCERFWAFGRYE
jgi:3'-phosphoadenosine 5'-phosphosulfate sulfotransferase (PAPS reductase)/FAD synthetase